MQLENKYRLDEFMQNHADSIKPLTSWIKLVRLAQWKRPQDIRNAIGSADFLSGNRVIFNIGGNKYRLMVVAVYAAGRLFVRWIGTHAEYSKMKF